MMGFPRGAAQKAYEHTGRPNVSLAVEWLLEHPEVIEGEVRCVHVGHGTRRRRAGVRNKVYDLCERRFRREEYKGLNIPGIENDMRRLRMGFRKVS